jgi:hypothetical protein
MNRRKNESNCLHKIRAALLALSPLGAVMSGMITLPSIAPIWIWQGILSILFLLAYVFARQIGEDMNNGK